MASEKGEPDEHAAGAARRVIGPVLGILVVLGILLSYTIRSGGPNAGWELRAAITVFVLAGLWVIREKIESSVDSALSGHPGKDNAVAAALSSVLAVGRRIGNVFARLLAAPPFRPLRRLALPLAIFLTAAMSYRLAAFLALLDRETGGSSGALAVLALDWVLFGFFYGLLGAVAPVAAVLLLFRRFKSSLVNALALNFLGLAGVSVAFLRATGGTGRSWLSIDGELMRHPLFAAPEALDFVMRLYFFEALASGIALYLLVRPHVRSRFDLNAEKGAE